MNYERSTGPKDHRAQSMNFVKNLSFLLVLLSFSAGSAEQEVIIDTQHVKDDIYMLKGQGGNIGISSGKDGLFMIDVEYASLSAKIKASSR